MYTLLLEINLSTLLYHPLSSFLDTSRHEDNKNKMKGEKNMDAKSEINSRVVHDERGGARWRKGTRVPRGRHMWIVTSQRNAGNVRLVATDAASMHKREHLAYHGIATPLHATLCTRRVLLHRGRTYVCTLGHDGACTGPGYRSCPQGRTTVYYREYRCESADRPLPLIELARLSSLLDIRWIVARWQPAPPPPPDFRSRF